MVDPGNSIRSSLALLVVGIVLVILAILVSSGMVIFIVRRRRKRFRRKKAPNRNETETELESSVRVDGDEEWGTFQEFVRRLSRRHAARSSSSSPSSSSSSSSSSPSSSSSSSPSSPSPAKVNQTRHHNIDPKPKDESPNRNETDDSVELRRRESSVRVDGDEERGMFYELIRRLSRMPPPSPSPAKFNQTRNIDLKPKDESPNRNETNDPVELRRRESSVRVDGDEEWGMFHEFIKELRRRSRMSAARSSLSSVLPAKVSEARPRNHDDSDPKDGETGEEYDPLAYYSTSKPGHAKHETGEYEKYEDDVHSLHPPSVPGPPTKRLPAIPLPTPTPINRSPTPKESSSATQKDTITPTPPHTLANSQPSVITPKRKHSNSTPRPPLPPIPFPIGHGSSHLQRSTTEVISTLLKSRITNVRKETDGNVEHIERTVSISNYSGRGGSRNRRLALPPLPLLPLPPLPPLPTTRERNVHQNIQP